MHREIQHVVHIQMYTGCTVVATFTAQGHSMQFIYVCILTELTRRHEGELDCIALVEVAQYCICTLDEESIQSSYTVNTSNGCSVFCSSFSSVHCTREGLGNGKLHMTNEKRQCCLESTGHHCTVLQYCMVSYKYWLLLSLCAHRVTQYRASHLNVEL